jgi:outer membrane protein OmpA-like peptidoglycan-associated protein
MFYKSKNSDDAGWLSLSDMMTVLMVLFLIISVTIAVTSTTRLAKMRGVLSYVTKQEDLLCQKLEDNLREKFVERDLQIECNPIRIIFTNPNYEFEKNSFELTESFKGALEIFFPIYLETVDRWELRDLVDEIRIEGHTDSDGGYIYNMALSQNRARNVLSFAIRLPELRKSESYFEWSRSLLTANGLSFSRRLNQNGEIMRFPFNGAENKDRSRRVEVKLRTNTKEVLMALQKRS